jgi:hypothetical protein
VLLGLADCTFEFEHYDVGLNYTVWTVAAMEAYDVLHDAFTPAERKKLDAFFERFLAALEKNDQYWIEHEPGGALNNHYAWHKLAFVVMGLFYDRPELVEYQALPQVKRVSIGDLSGRLCANVRQLRTCVVRADYVLDFFQVQAEEGLVPGPYWEQFHHGERRFRIDLATSSPAQLVRCGFPRDDGPKPAVIPMRMFRSDACSAWYAAVYRSGPKADEALKVSVSPGPLDSWLVTVDLASSHLAHRVPRLPGKA